MPTAAAIDGSARPVRRRQRLTIRDWFDGSTVRRRDWFFSSICKKSQDVAFVIDGWALEIALKHYRKAFTELSILSRTAICCHFTPSQKAQIDLAMFGGEILCQGIPKIEPNSDLQHVVEIKTP